MRIKAAAAGLLGLAAIGAVGFEALAASARSRLARRWDVPVAAVAEGAAEQGAHVAAMSCANCHGADLAGAPVFDDPALATIDAPNLTPGRGSATAGYADRDWVRAIRHGVARDGRALLIMPAKDFGHLSDADLGGLVAHLRALPPVDRETRPVRTTHLGQALLAVGAFGDVLHAESIDHGAPVPSAPAADPAARGAYLVATLGCRTCHGPALTGGKDANPDAPPGPDLTPAGRLGGWSEAQFVATMRTGRTPDGRQLSDFMPWRTLGQADDAELHALWVHLTTPGATGRPAP